MASPTPPATPAFLNVVALISGGKDSMFSLLHCLANGHKVIALANLYPEQESQVAFDVPHESSLTGAQWDRDVDSFMYQTAGHNLIPLYSDALDLPLYRQQIVGHARDPSLSYSGHEEDETEALVPLLKKIKHGHPEINAVSSGAILSTYQRTRIESVAIRLGLVPLAYLWQYPSLPPPSPGGMLEDMANAGFDVRIVKVASGGLDGTLLWSNLMDPSIRRKLEKAVNRFGGSVLGEGGEYETMVIRGPSETVAMNRASDDIAIDTSSPLNAVPNVIHFWRGSIKVAEADMHTTTEQGSHGLALLTFRKGSGQLLAVDHGIGESKQRPILRIPAVWDPEFRELLQLQLQSQPGDFVSSDDSSYAAPSGAKSAADRAVQNLKNLEESTSEGLLTKPNLEESNDYKGHYTLTVSELEECTRIRQIGNTYVITNLIGVSFGSTTQEQMRGVKVHLLAKLDDIKRPTSSIVSTTLILCSMADFAAVNLIYGELFPKPNPPARVTMACALPAGTKLMLSVVISLNDKFDALHVQSRSYWAPANIGPYSQAVSMSLHDTLCARLVFVAGQIPLVPGTMDLLGPPIAQKGSTDDNLQWQDAFWLRCCFSLQHIWRIGREMKVSWWTGAIAFITGGSEAFSKATMAWAAWHKAHAPRLWEQGEKEDDNEVDVWHRKHGGLGSLNLGVKEERILPDFGKVIDQSQEPYPLSCNNLAWTYHVEEIEMPNVPGFFAVKVDELPRGSDIEWQSLGLAYSEVRVMTHSITDGDCHLQARTCTIDESRTCVSYIEVPVPTTLEHRLTTRGLSRGIDWVRNVSDPASDLLITIYTPHVSLAVDMEAQIVPCHAVWGPEGRRLGAAIVTQFKIKD